MNLRIGLCLRFTEILGETSALACRIGYTRLLEVLLAHPEIKINLLLGGTFLDALCWFDSRPIDLVRTGIAGGQFRLVGSTYAQNLMPVCDDWDNRRQMALHRQTLRRVFSAEPSVFVCPDGACQASLAPGISAAGYTTVVLEESILRAAGAQVPVVYRLGGSPAGLQLLWNDESLRASLAFASWFHEGRRWKENIQRLKSICPDGESTFVVIDEDADVFFQWGYRDGFDPRADISGLENALQESLAAGCEFLFLEDAPAAQMDLAVLPEGWNKRLDFMLEDPDWPEHEDGYNGWIDFRSRAPKIAHFRRIHAAIRTKLIALEQSLPVTDGESAVDQFLRWAVRSYCTHQYRFGRPGSGGRGTPAWEGIGSALMLACAAERAAFPQKAPNVLIDDVTGDGEDEVLLRKDDHLAVLSPCGGRMLGWFNLAQARMHVGNPFVMPLGSLLMETLPVTPAELTDDWLSDEDPPGKPVYDERGEHRLHRLGKPFPRNAGDVLPVWPRPRRFGSLPALPGRRRAFNDFLAIDDGPEEQSEQRLDFRVEEGGVTFLRFFHYRVELIKRICLTTNGVRVSYRFRNVTSEPHQVRMRLVSELCPDGQAVGAAPGRILEPAFFGPRMHAGILNTHTGQALVCLVSRPVSAPVAFQPAVLAWEVVHSFAFTLEPGKSQWLYVRLNIIPSTQPMQPVLIT